MYLYYFIYAYYLYILYNHAHQNIKVPDNENTRKTHRKPENPIIQYTEYIGKKTFRLTNLPSLSKLSLSREALPGCDLIAKGLANLRGRRWRQGEVKKNEKLLFFILDVEVFYGFSRVFEGLLLRFLGVSRVSWSFPRVF